MTLSPPLLATISVLVHSAICPYLLKRFTETTPWRRSFSEVFLICGIVSFFLASIAGERFSSAHLPIFALGICTAFIAYAQWKAVAISQSKTVLFSQLGDVLGIVLGLIILHEGRYLGRVTAIGVMLSIVSAFQLSRLQKFGKSTKSDNLFPLLLIIAVGFGVSLFAYRFFSHVVSVPLLSYLAAHYAGAGIGSFCVTTFLFGKEESESTLGVREHITSAMLALSAMLNAGLSYLAFKYYPLSVLNPLYQVSYLLVPLLIGLFVFDERREIYRGEWIWMAIALLGAAMTIVGLNI